MRKKQWDVFGIAFLVFSILCKVGYFLGLESSISPYGNTLTAYDIECVMMHVISFYLWGVFLILGIAFLICAMLEKED